MRLLLGAIVSLVLLSTGAQAWQWPWVSADEIANKLFVESVQLFEKHQALSDKDPSHYEERLKLLTKVDENLKSILQDYPESLLAVELASSGAIKQLNQEQIEAEIPRLQQSIAAAPLMAEIDLLWQQYQALAVDDVAQYEERLSLLYQVDNKIEKLPENYPLSYDVSGLATDVQYIKAQISRFACVSDVQCPLQLALKTAKEGRFSAQDHAEMLASVATVQAISGDPAGARTTLLLALKQVEGVVFEGNAGESSRAKALASVATAQSGSGDPAGARTTLTLALKTAEGVPDDWIRVEALASVATAQSGSGDPAGARTTLTLALKTAESILDDDNRARALAAVAAAQSASGDVAGTLKTAESITDDYWRAKALASVATAQSGSGDTAGARTTLTLALKTAESIDYYRVEALASIATAQAASGDIAGALKTAEGNTGDVEYAPALASIATAQAASGDVAGALKTAERVTSDTFYYLGYYWRPAALADIARAQAAFGDTAGAKTTLLLALETAESISDDDGYDRVMALTAISTAIVKVK